MWTNPIRKRGAKRNVAFAFGDAIFSLWLLASLILLAFDTASPLPPSTGLCGEIPMPRICFSWGRWMEGWMDAFGVPLGQIQLSSLRLVAFPISPFALVDRRVVANSNWCRRLGATEKGEA